MPFFGTFVADYLPCWAVLFPMRVCFATSGTNLFLELSRPLNSHGLTLVMISHCQF